MVEIKQSKMVSRPYMDVRNTRCASKEDKRKGNNVKERKTKNSYGPYGKKVFLHFLSLAR